MRVLLVLLFSFGVVNGQDRFRSILIKRACLRRPSLDFCKDFDNEATTPISTTTKESIPLIIPPEPSPTTKVEVTEKPVTSTTTTKKAEDVTKKAEEVPKEKEIRGNLLRLPKPIKTGPESAEVVDHEIDHFEQVLSTTTTNSTDDIILPSTTTEKVPEKVEDGKSILVFVSEYCVIERERFVRNCHGETIDKSEMPFCKSYPSACSTTHGVLPVISYCQRYYSKYPKHCTGDIVPDDAIQFCYAFEQFCLPELTPAEQPAGTIDKVVKPSSTLKKCEDIVDEARKVCNPFPHPKDTFNVIRCSQFLTNCKKYVDWA